MAKVSSRRMGRNRSSHLLYRSVLYCGTDSWTGFLSSDHSVPVNGIMFCIYYSEGLRLTKEHGMGISTTP